MIRFRLLVSPLLGAALACALAAPARAGVSGPLGSADQSWWACEIRSRKPSGLYLCSGVLVDPRTILTSKHCLTGEPIDVMSVWCGGSWVDGPTSWNYPSASDAYDADIALVTVSRDFWYSDQYSPKLPDSAKTSDEILKKGGDCTTWGFGEGPDGRNEYLRWQRVADVNKAASPSFMSQAPSVINHGDSGGPVVCVTGPTGDFTTSGKTIVAINTAFNGSAQDWMLRVDPFRAWICAAISNGGACRPDPAPKN